MNLRQRIQRDTRRVGGDPEVAALLACLVEHLFDPNLDAAFLARVSGAGREVRERLAATVGPLKAYITELRMIEARRLVRETDLTNADLSKRLGYGTLRTFYRAFKQFHRVTPDKMRKQARAEQKAATALDTPTDVARKRSDRRVDPTPEPRLPEPATSRASTARARRRAALRLIDAGAAGELRSHLRSLHPELEEAATPDGATPDHASPDEQRWPLILMPTGDHLESFAAGAVFDRILALPRADQRHAMLDGMRIGSSTAFEMLMQLCTGHTRWNPEGAVAVAELGVQLLEMHRGAMAEKADDWMAYGWACLARVKLLTSDFAGADRALDFAWEEVPQGYELPPWIELEIRRVEGMVQMHQGHGKRAADALDRAVELGRTLPFIDPARATSVADRLVLASFSNDAQAGFECCDELETLIEAGAAGTEATEYWRGLVAYHRGRSYAIADRDDLAEACWRQAGKHVVADQDATDPPGAATYETAVLGSFVVHELARLAGRLTHSAYYLEVYETLLREAISRYQLAGTTVFEATAKAELAALVALCGRADEARPLAASAADFLEALPCHRRAWNAASRLRVLANGGAGAPMNELEDVLAALCDDLDKVRWEITGAQTPAARAAIEARRAEA